MVSMIRSGRIGSNRMAVASPVCIVGASALVIALLMSLAPQPALAATLSALSPAMKVRLSGHVLPALAGAALLSTGGGEKSSVVGVEPNESSALTLTVVLKREDQEGFEAYLHDLYDPASSIFRRFMTPTEIAETFGPSRQAYDETLAWLRTNNLELREGSANRMTLTVQGERAAVERAFGVAVRDYALGDRKFHAIDDDPVLPASIATHVQAVNGLSNLAVPRSILDNLPDTQANRALWYALCANEAVNGGVSAYTGGPLAFFKIFLAEEIVFLSLLNSLINIAQASDLSSSGTGAQYAKCVNMYNRKYNYGLIGGRDPPPPAWQAADGTGQTVGLVEFDAFLMSDVTDYTTLMGQASGPASNVSVVHVNGGATLGSSQDEVLLDIADVLTAAPGALIKVFDAPFSGTSFQTMFNAMINGGVTIISNSWAYCENQTTLADIQSIDSVLQTAAAAGISVFSGTGDRGSTCLNGSPGVAHVPATSRWVTAVGGSAAQANPGFTYGGETWWDDSGKTPAGGQGGFGVSKFLDRPAYQDGMTASTKRSIPDVVASASPYSGVMICQASKGGCPSGARYGGTSSATPLWAAFAALLNQTQGSNLGFLNPQLYPLANTNAFHNAASMNSDFAHVGLGSPNLARLHLRLTGQTVGPVSLTESSVIAYAQTTATLSPGATRPLPAFADGVNQTFIVVQLADAKGNPVGNKTVTVSTTTPSNVVFTPTTLPTGAETGVAIFVATNTTAETVTVRASIAADSIILPQMPRIQFMTPPAAAGSITALTGSASANGIDTDTITVVLQDSLGRPTPGKKVSLTQNGSSVVKAPASAVTNNSGQIQFTVTNSKQETVVYKAIDESDGGLQLPTTASVAFGAGGGDNCGSTNFGDPNITAGIGYAITPFATGFLPKISNYGGLNNGCRGVSGLAFDASGNLFASDIHTGNIYKFGPAGGVAGPANLLPNSTTLGPGVGTLTFDHSGRLYAAQNATTGNFFTGAVREINPANGALVRTAASSITCAAFLATDPASGDLFVDDSCGGGGSDNGSIWRISNLNNPIPTVTIYAATPGTNGGLTFSTGGSLYVIDYTENGVAQFSGTAKPQPPQKTVLSGLTLPTLDISVMGAQANGDAKTVIMGRPAFASEFPAGIKAYDITTNPITPLGVVVNNAFAAVQLIGPDNCLYASVHVAVYKITNADGSCPLTFGNPSLVVTPGVSSPNPAQGGTRTFTSAFHYVNAPAGTAVTFVASGANTLERLAYVDGNGNAAFTYKGVNAGTDAVVATARVNGVTLASNTATVTWIAGVHSTALDVDLAPASGTVGSAVGLTASLTDLSASPVTPIASAAIHFILGGQTCDALTDAAGVASCNITPSVAGNFFLSASFTGTSQYSAATASKNFLVNPPIRLDIDGNGSYDALTDGLLILRWMFGLTGTGLTSGALGPNATRIVPSEIIAYLTALRPALDVDANTQVDALTDGLMIIRYMFGLRGASVVSNALGPNATRTSAAAIESYIQSLMP